MTGSVSVPSSDPRALYLDLMIRAVANTIYEDDSIHPRRGGPFAAAQRRDGRDWPRTAHSMIGVRRLENLRDLCERAILDGVPGDFLEAGVWRGGACILMRAVLAAHGDPGRRVWCCDSFEGLPPPDAARYPADVGDAHHAVAELAVPLETVRANFARYGLLDDRTRFVRGFFRDTLPGLPAERLALIRADGDMYESTIQTLEALYPRLSSGGFVVIDDYGAVPGCRMAVEDFRAARGIGAPLETVDWTGRWWRKA